MHMPIMCCLPGYQAARRSLMLWIIFQDYSGINRFEYVSQGYVLFGHLLLSVLGHSKLFCLGVNADLFQYCVNSRSI